MERIGNYQNYDSVYRQGSGVKETAAAKTADTKAANESAKADSKVSLSSGAKNLLKELQKKYGNMDFIIADYETDEEAAAYLARGAGEYSVLMTPEELEKMAADEKYKKQNLQTLDDAVSKLKDMKSQLGQSGNDVKRVGLVIGNDGEISYFAELEKTNEKQRERIDRQRENRKAEAATAEKKAEKKKAEETGNPAGRYDNEGVKRTMVYASSVKELAEKIGQVDWSTVKEENYNPRGNHFDFTA